MTNAERVLEIAHLLWLYHSGCKLDEARSIADDIEKLAAEIVEDIRTYIG